MKREFPGFIGDTIYKSFKKAYGLKVVILPVLLCGEKRIKRLYAYYKGIYDGMKDNITIYDTTKIKEQNHNQNYDKNNRDNFVETKL